jgi:hypothetical protein
MPNALGDIKLYDGTVETMPRMQTVYNQNQTIVLSVRNYVDGKLVVETNPGATDPDEAWLPVLWEDGSEVIFQGNGDAVLPACNNRIRVRYDTVPATLPKITLI